MAFAGEKMNSTRRERYNANRRERLSKTRQALLINDYIYIKHPEIYRKAAECYNSLNAKYPTKKDLRRCKEFKAMKAMKTPQRTYPYHVIVHPNISLELSESTAQELANTDTDTDIHLPVTEPPTPQRTYPYHVIVQPNIPLELSESAAQELADTDTHLPVTEPPTNRLGNKIMELKIPLLEPAIITQTLQEVTQETLQVAAQEIVDDDTILHPTLEEGLPQDIINDIIKELRTDPEFRSIMTDMEQAMEFDQLGNDLSSPEPDRLEEDLQNIALW